MFGVFKYIFGQDDTTKKIVDGVINGADALFFTDEEKSVANQKVLDWKLEFAKTTQGSNISRRFISHMVSIIWGLWTICILGAILLSGFFNTIPTLTLLLNDYHVVSLSFGAILSWYYANNVFANRKK